MSVDTETCLTQDANRIEFIEPIKPNDHKAARRRAIALFILICLLIALIPLGLIAASMLGAFGPKSIDAGYNQTDLISAVNKLDLKFISADGSHYKSILELTKKEAGEAWNHDISHADFNWTYDNYTLAKVELSGAELQALICEASPLSLWTDQLQIKVSKDKTIELSALLKFDSVLSELFPQERAELPVSGFKRISVYLQARPSIYENQLELNTEEIKIGPLQIIDNALLDQNAIYLERIYRNVPDLIIHSLELTSRGTVRLTMTIPQSIRAEYIGRD